MKHFMIFCKKLPKSAFLADFGNFLQKSIKCFVFQPSQNSSWTVYAFKQFFGETSDVFKTFEIEKIKFWDIFSNFKVFSQKFGKNQKNVLFWPYFGLFLLFSAKNLKMLRF